MYDEFINLFEVYARNKFLRGFSVNARPVENRSFTFHMAAYVVSPVLSRIRFHLQIAN